MPDDPMRLAARCEAATGPDRELDCDIGVAFGLFERDLMRPGMVIKDGRSGMGWPAFTASLDAAMTLVPENHAVNIDNGPCHWICLGKQKPMGRVDVRYPKHDYDGEGDSWLTVSAIAATPALALCAAALKAAAALRAKERNDA